MQLYLLFLFTVLISVWQNAALVESVDLVLPQTPTRVEEVTRITASELTRERFTNAILQGELLLVEGGAVGWPALSTWSVEWFEERLPEEPVEFRMGGTKEDPIVRAIEATGGVTLGTYRQAAERLDKPYYLGWGNQKEETSNRWFKPYMVTPEYFPENFEVQQFRTEWMYFGTQGSGVDWHVDPQCHPKFSVHVEGDKLWRLRRWWGEGVGVEYQTVVRKGDVLLFYPQFLHSTTVLSNNSLAYTGYIETPRDTPFIRELIEAAENNDQFGPLYHKCYKRGATLKGIQNTCRQCRELKAGHPKRPHLCDLPHGIKMCDGLKRGKIAEAPLPWDINKEDAAALPRGEQVRITFSGSQDIVS